MGCIPNINIIGMYFLLPVGSGWVFSSENKLLQVCIIIYIIAFPNWFYFREKVKSMFYHAYNGYLDKAYPLDELKPLTCQGSISYNFSI